MPRYDFKNKETNEIEEHQMSYTVYDQFLIDNPHLERYHSAENLPVPSDAMRLDVPGTKKCDPAFEKYVINRIKEKVPGNKLGERHKTHCSKEW